MVGVEERENRGMDKAWTKFDLFDHGLGMFRSVKLHAVKYWYLFYLS
jgi:hypothetical protein